MLSSQCNECVAVQSAAYLQDFEPVIPRNACIIAAMAACAYNTAFVAQYAAGLIPFSIYSHLICVYAISLAFVSLHHNNHHKNHSMQASLAYWRLPFLSFA